MGAISGFKKWARPPGTPQWGTRWPGPLSEARNGTGIRARVFHQNRNSRSDPAQQAGSSVDRPPLGGETPGARPGPKVGQRTRSRNFALRCVFGLGGRARQNLSAAPGGASAELLSETPIEQGGTQPERPVFPQIPPPQTCDILPLTSSRGIPAPVKPLLAVAAALQVPLLQSLFAVLVPGGTRPLRPPRAPAPHNIQDVPRHPARQVGVNGGHGTIVLATC
jgi:hypothetical protein